MAANDFQYASTPLPGDIAVKNTEASADISAGQAVTLDASHLLSGTQYHCGAILATTDDYILGIAMENIPNGKTGRVRTAGIAQAVCSAAITAGALVQAGASGKLKTLTSAKPQVGQSLTGTSSDGDKFLVALAFAKNA